MKHHKPAYKVGLGREFLDRTALIFIILFLILLATGGSAVYAEFKTGELNKRFVEPTKKFFSDIGKAFEVDTTKDGLSNVEVNINYKGNVKINTETSSTPAVPTPFPIPAYPSKSYEEALKEQEAWSQQKQSENQKWFEEQTAKNEQASQDWFNQKVQESQKQLEEWKKQHGL